MAAGAANANLNMNNLHRGRKSIYGFSPAAYCPKFRCCCQIYSSAIYVFPKSCKVWWSLVQKYRGRNPVNVKLKLFKYLAKCLLIVSGRIMRSTTHKNVGLCLGNQKLRSSSWSSHTTQGGRLVRRGTDRHARRFIQLMAPNWKGL